MRPESAPLGEIVARIGGCIELMRAQGLEDAARLLSMAKLDVQMRMHAVSDRELRALCAVLERGAPARRPEPVAGGATVTVLPTRAPSSGTQRPPGRGPRGQPPQS